MQVTLSASPTAASALPRPNRPRESAAATQMQQVNFQMLVAIVRTSHLDLLFRSLKAYSMYTLLPRWRSSGGTGTAGCRTGTGRLEQSRRVNVRYAGQSG